MPLDLAVHKCLNSEFCDRSSRIALKFDRCFDSLAVDASIKFKSDRTIKYSTSRLCGVQIRVIVYWNSFLDIYSLMCKTCYHQISRNLEATRFLQLSDHSERLSKFRNDTTILTPAFAGYYDTTYYHLVYSCPLFHNGNESIQISIRAV